MGSKITKSLLLFSAASLYACDSGSISLPVGNALLCTAPEQPAPSTVLTPAFGDLYQPGDALQIQVAAAEQEEARNLEFEIWLMAQDQPVLKIWGGQSTEDQIDVEASGFEAGFTALDAWKSYAVRTRTKIGEPECDFGEWGNYQSFRIDDGSELFFNEEVIRDLYISLPEESFEAIDREALPPECVPYHRPYHPGTVTFDGTVYENAGVRTKGGCGSSRNLSGKASFKINLSDYSTGDSCPQTRRARGLKRLTVNNQVQDPSHAHERLAYQFYDLLGIPVPRRAPIRVHVNDELWGLYLHLESIDRRFFRRRYEGLAAEGMAYEGTYYCDIVPINAPAEMGPETCFSAKFSGQCSTPVPGADPTTYAPLISFIAQIDALDDENFYEGIQDIVDFKTFLNQWAADSIMNHWDGSIFDILNNYRMYHNPETSKWVILPTGMDQSFNLNQRNIDPWQPLNVIARRCLQIKECEDAFAQRLREVLSVFENGDFVARTGVISTQIAEEVAADPREETNQFAERINRTVTFIEGRKSFIENALSAHGY